MKRKLKKNMEAFIAFQGIEKIVTSMGGNITYRKYNLGQVRRTICGYNDNIMVLRARFPKQEEPKFFIQDVKSLIPEAFWVSGRHELNGDYFDVDVTYEV